MFQIIWHEYLGLVPESRLYQLSVYTGSAQNLPEAEFIKSNVPTCTAYSLWEQKVFRKNYFLTSKWSPKIITWSSSKYYPHQFGRAHEVIVRCDCQIFSKSGIKSFRKNFIFVALCCVAALYLLVHMIPLGAAHPYVALYTSH